MLISRQSDYAIRIVRALSDMKLHSASEIESQERVTVAFSYKILKMLALNGIVEIIRGSNGGYKLIKECDELTLFDIIDAVDDDFVINECMRDGYCCTSNNKECSVHKEFCRIQKVLIKELKRNKLSQII